MVYLLVTNTRTALLLLKTFSKDVFDHLNGCYKTTSAGVEVKWMFACIELTCLTRLEIPLPFAPFTEMSSVLDGDSLSLNQEPNRCENLCEY